MFFGEVVAGLDKGADGGGSGVEDGDLVALDHVPEASEVGVVGGAFIHDLGDAIGERAVDDVGVSGDPAHVGGAPVDIVVTHVEDVFASGVGSDEVARAGVEDAFRFTG